MWEPIRTAAEELKPIFSSGKLSCPFPKAVSNLDTMVKLIAFSSEYVILMNELVPGWTEVGRDKAFFPLLIVNI